jgi:hypothetical protein
MAWLREELRATGHSLLLEYIRDDKYRKVSQLFTDDLDLLRKTQAGFTQKSYGNSSYDGLRAPDDHLWSGGKKSVLL